MKRVLLLLILVLGLAAQRGQAQGTVTFGNNSSSALTNGFTMQRLIAGTIFRVALYYMPDGPEPTREQMLLLGVQIGASAPIAPAAGLYAAGTRTTPVTTPGAGFAWFQVRAWETAFGTSYEQALLNTMPQNGRLAATGRSNIIRVKTGDPVNNIAPGALTAFGLQTFCVGSFECVPEPTSFAMAALGLGALILLRRKS
jgi:hypothetical protein